MEKINLLRLIPTKLNSVRFHTSISFSRMENVLKVIISDVTGNMQDNKSAFEGWIICLKSRLPDKILKVELEWTLTGLFPEESFLLKTQTNLLAGKKMYQWFAIAIIISGIVLTTIPVL